MVLLRVCAPEVKKKFQKCKTKKRCVPEKYFLEEYCDKKCMPSAGKMRIVLWRRRLACDLSAPTWRQNAGGTPAPREPARSSDAQE